MDDMRPPLHVRKGKMNPTFRDRARYKPCQGEGCTNLVLPPRRKCNKCRKTKKYTVTELRPSRKGMNKRGTCLHKPDKRRTKRAKRQNPQVMGMQPNDLSAYTYRADRT